MLRGSDSRSGGRGRQGDMADKMSWKGVNLCISCVSPAFRGDLEIRGALRSEDGLLRESATVSKARAIIWSPGPATTAPTEKESRHDRDRPHPPVCR